jgi:hypothetical protein
MLKLLIFLLGLVGGGGAVAAWLLSEPGPSITPQPTLDRDSLQARLNDLKARFDQALQEGEQAGRETEQQLQRELAAYRKDPNRAPAG